MSEARPAAQVRNPSDAPSPELKASRIRELNDQFRTTLIGGRSVITSGIAALDETLVARIVTRVRSFSNFDTDNDPHHEHDFGAFEIDGHKIFFKIDYYDKALEFGSPDPADPAVLPSGCCRSCSRQSTDGPFVAQRAVRRSARTAQNFRNSFFALRVEVRPSRFLAGFFQPQKCQEILFGKDETAKPHASFFPRGGFAGCIKRRRVDEK